MTTASEGAAALVAHLKSTGTGEGKLSIAAAAPMENAKTAHDGAVAVVEHLKACGVNPTTIGKAEAFVASLATPKAKSEEAAKPADAAPAPKGKKNK